MKILLWVLGGILVLDVVLVVVFAVCAMFARRRRRRELGKYPSLWGLEEADLARDGVRPRLLVRRGGGEALLREEDEEESRASIHLVGPTDMPTSGAGRKPPARRRLVAAGLAAAVFCAGTALASPRVREVVTTAFQAVAGGFGSAPATQDSEAAPDDVGIDESSQTGPGRSAAPAPEGTSNPKRGPIAPTDISGTRTDPSHPAAPPDIVTRPATPRIFTAVAASSARIDLAWADVPDETAYRIERSSDGVNGWNTITTTGQDVTTYGDTGLASGTTFYYRIFATKRGADSAPSDVTSATTTIDPASPTTLVAVPGSSTEIILTWTDVADETGYRVERSADGVNGWNTITTTGQDVTTYDDAGLAPDTTYYYRIFATNGGGDSPPSDVESATTAVAVGSTPIEPDPARR